MNDLFVQFARNGRGFDGEFARERGRAVMIDAQCGGAVAVLQVESDDVPIRFFAQRVGLEQVLGFRARGRFRRWA